MGAIIGVLITIFASSLLIINLVSNFIWSKQQNRIPYITKKVADQTYKVFMASIKYMSGIGVQPTNWSIEELKNTKILPSTFDDRTSLGESYKIYYIRDYCNPKVMDLVIKIDDDNSKENKAKWDKYGLSYSELGKRAIYTEITQELKDFDYSDLNMKNPCNANLPDHYIGYVLNGKVYVDGQLRTDIKLPSSLLQNDGIFIYGFAPNQWGYLVVTFKFLRGDELVNEYYDYTSVSSVNQVYYPEFVWWRQVSIVWSTICPDGYIDLSNQPIGYEKSVNYGFLNFCVPGFKSDLTLDKINRLRTEFRKIYGVDSNYNPSNTCAEYMEVSRFDKSLTNFIAHRTYTLCTNTDFSDNSHIDNVFNDIVNRYVYSVEKEAWGGRTADWLKENEPLFKYPKPNMWAYRSITFKDPLKNRYYQLVAYFYKFYTGKGCSPASLGLNGKSNLTGFSYPPKANIWTTGWKWARRTNPQYVSSTVCSPTYLNGLYTNLGTSYRNIGSKIIVRVLDNPDSASYYNAKVYWKKDKLSPTQTFIWKIESPIY